MADPRLDEARSLKKKATALRNRGQLDRALDTLDEAVRLLEGAPGHPPTDREIRAELADTFGMTGGVLRRKGDLDAALTAYGKGRDIEVADKQGTYNVSNVITLKIAQKGLSPADPDISADLQQTIDRLETDTAGARGDEWWAWSDLAQFYLLHGEPAKARACYAKAISKTGATAEEIRRHAQILGDLRDKLAKTAPEIAQSIDVAIGELTR